MGHKRASAEGSAHSPSSDDSTSAAPDGPHSGDTVDSADTALLQDTATSEEVPEFVLWSETRLADGALLSFDTNLPSDLQDCLSMEVRGAPCIDVDEDGLTDTWEDLLLLHFRPLVRLDEDEPFVEDPEAVLVQLGRVTPASSGALFVPIVLAWSQDYGRCGVSAHHGDSERVALQVLRTSSTAATIHAVYTAAHEGEVTDQGAIWTEDTLGMLEQASAHDGLHWIVYVSEGKHASYGTAEACEAASLVPCIEEDCAPDGVTDTAPFDRLPDIWNMGEPAHPLWTDLAELGLPGEDPWVEQRFCGGLDRTDACSSPLVEKLIESPF